MLTRHYNRNGRRSQRIHPDAELEANLAKRETERKERDPRSDLRGIGVVTPPRRVRYHKPRHVRRSQGYIASNGAWIATAEAPYLELSRDVQRTRYARHMPQAEVKTTQAAATVQTAKAHVQSRYKMDWSQ